MQHTNRVYPTRGGEGSRSDAAHDAHLYPKELSLALIVIRWKPERRETFSILGDLPHSRRVRYEVLRSATKCYEVVVVSVKRPRRRTLGGDSENVR